MEILRNGEMDQSGYRSLPGDWRRRKCLRCYVRSEMLCPTKQEPAMHRLDRSVLPYMSSNVRVPTYFRSKASRILPIMPNTFSSSSLCPISCKPIGAPLHCSGSPSISSAPWPHKTKNTLTGILQCLIVFRLCLEPLYRQIDLWILSQTNGKRCGRIVRSGSYIEDPIPSFGICTIAVEQVGWCEAVINWSFISYSIDLVM